MVLLALAGCLPTEDRVSGRGSEVENELGLKGTLIDQNGKAVASARVKAIPAGTGILDSQTVFTDANGKYRFDSLGAGEYNLLGDYQDGALVAYIPGLVYADTAVPQSVGKDTLFAPGRIRGAVQSQGAPLAGVLCYVPGISYLAITDDSGRFEISRIPKGRYTVRYSLAGYLTQSDTGITVGPGRIAQLPNKELMLDPEGNPPAPLGLQAEFDTLRALVRLRWRKVPVSDLQGYFLYRDEGAGERPQALHVLPLVDTVYTDTLRPPIPVGKTFYYRVKALDREANQSLSFSAPVPVLLASSAEAMTTLRLEFRGRSGRVGSIQDSIPMAAVYANPGRSIRKVEWFLDQSSVPACSAAVSSRGAEIVFSPAWNEPGTHLVRVVAWDDAGMPREITDSAIVILDPPVADAGKDTLVTIGDDVGLRSHGGDGMGRIVKWEWDIGLTGTFQAVAAGDTLLRMPATPRTLACALRVTDDDGLSALDTVQVQVTLDPPVARISGNPLATFVNDTLTLLSRESRDSLGKIVKWEWDIGKTGLFMPGDSSGAFRFVTPPAPNSAFRCALRVTDDDGLTDVREISLPIRARNAPIKLAAELIFEDQMGKPLVAAMNGKPWVLGRMGQGGNNLGVWSSEDLLTWRSVTADFPEATARAGNWEAFLGHAGKLWFAHSDAESNMFLWSSADGGKWELVADSTLLPKWKQFTLFSFADKLWIIGGVRYDSTWNQFRRNDEAWSSKDGKHWELANAQTGLGIRQYPALAEMDGKLWLYGGERVTDTVTQLNDLWYTADGAHWTLAKDRVFPEPRVHATLAGQAGALWLTGHTYPEGVEITDIWMSPSGSSWAKSMELPKNENRLATFILEFGGRVILMEQTRGFKQEWVTTIWRLP